MISLFTTLDCGVLTKEFYFANKTNIKNFWDSEVTTVRPNFHICFPLICSEEIWCLIKWFYFQIHITKKWSIHLTNMFLHLCVSLSYPKDMKHGKIPSNSATLTRPRWLLNAERASNIRCLSSCCYLCALVGGTSVFGNCEHLCENQMRKKPKEKSSSKPTWRGS